MCYATYKRILERFLYFIVLHTLSKWSGDKSFIMENLFFISGDKSFELKNTGDTHFSWFSLIERGRRFTSKVSLDPHNLWWVCEILIQASNGYGQLYRRWSRKQQHNLYRVYQNFNVYGRFVRIEVWHGSSKSAVIIPEMSFNSGWTDSRLKSFDFWGNSTSQGHHQYRLHWQNPIGLLLA